MSSSSPRRLGMLFRNQMWATGTASSMWPMRSRRTRAIVTSTPAVAHDVLVLDALVLAAGALVVAHRPEDLLAEEAARLGLERAVVDRLGVLDLSLGPLADRLGRRDGDRHAVERALVHSK